MPSDTKKRVYLAAVDLFSKKGYTGTSLSEIAEMVGLRQASLYNYYKAKDDLLTAVFRDFEESYTRHRPTPETILSTAENQSLEAALAAIFYRFDAGEETDRMMKVTKIVFSLKYEDPRAADLMNRIMLDGALAVRQDIFDVLQTAGKIKKCDTRWLAYMFFSFSFVILQRLLLHDLVIDEVADDFSEGIKYMAVTYAQLLNPSSPV